MPLAPFLWNQAFHLFGRPRTFLVAALAAGILPGVAIAAATHLPPVLKPATDGQYYLIQNAELSESHISPPACADTTCTGDGVKDYTLIRYRVPGLRPTDTGVFVDSADGRRLGALIPLTAREAGLTYVHVFRGVLPGGNENRMLDDGFYRMTIMAIDDTGRVETLFLPLEIDRRKPQIRQIATRDNRRVYRNGDTIEIEADLDSTHYLIGADFSGINSDTAGATTYFENPPRHYVIRHDLPAGNTHRDTTDVPIRLTFTDMAGNRIPYSAIRLCLSNSPPVLVSSRVTNLSSVFRNGMTVHIETRWRSPNGPFRRVTADFRGIDSRFDSTRVTAEPLEATPGDPTLQAWQISYTLDLENNMPDRDDYLVPIHVLDSGCGEGFDQSVAITLDNERPLPPTVDPITSPTRNAVLAITGRAPGAAQVEIKRGVTALDTAAVGYDGAWSAAAPLVEGENTLTADAVDAAGNRSLSTTFSVYRLVRAFVTLPPRFVPGNAIQLGLTRTGQSARVELWNLSGDLVAVIEDNAPRDLYVLTWNGLDASGRPVRYGPIVSRIEIRYPDGATETMNKAFLLVTK